MAINIYHLHEPLFTIVLHYIIFIVHIQLRGHIIIPNLYFQNIVSQNNKGTIGGNKT